MCTFPFSHMRRAQKLSLHHIQETGSEWSQGQLKATHLVEKAGMRTPGSLTSNPTFCLTEMRKVPWASFRTTQGPHRLLSPGGNLPSSLQFVSSHQLPASRPLLALSSDVPKPHGVSTERDKNLMRTPRAAWVDSQAS